LIAAAGVLVAAVVYLLGAWVFDLALSEHLVQGGDPTRLGAADLGLVVGLVMLVALVASAAGAVRAGRVSPAEGLRETIR
jgi:putative ABC transport system permease protein